MPNKMIYREAGPVRRDATKGTLSAVISTAAPDRYETVILPSAFEKRLASYQANPIVLWGHDMRRLPVGKAAVTITEAALQAEITWADTPEGRQIRSLYDAGILRGFSHGSIPHAGIGIYSTKEEKASLPPELLQMLEDGVIWRVYTDMELFEISAVNVPANPEALAAAVHQGLCTREFAAELARGTDADPILAGIGALQGAMVERLDRVEASLARMEAKLCPEDQDGDGEPDEDMDPDMDPDQERAGAEGLARAAQAEAPEAQASPSSPSPLVAFFASLADAKT